MVKVCKQEMLIVFCLTTEAVTAALSIINYYGEVFIAEETLINYERPLVTFVVLFSLYGDIQYILILKTQNLLSKTFSSG